MALHAERTAVEWFEDADYWYAERHQGCACCGGERCVFRAVWGRRVEYYCSVCDFSACRDGDSNSYYAVAGQGPGPQESELDSAIRCALRKAQ